MLVTAEFNPLHLGHAHFLSQVRRAHPGCLLVCLMSGNFVQRGSPAVADRWVRSGMALKAGADVVLELPALYAVQGAAGFARGAVRIADRLGADVLAFGAESAQIEPLERAAALFREEPPQMAAAIRDGRRRGLNQGAARQRALAAADPALAPLLSGPNNTLAIEYLSALDEIHSAVRPYLVVRTAIHGCRPSAQQVRAELQQADDPGDVLRRWGVPLCFTPVFAEEELYRLGLYRLRTTAREQLLATADVSPALAARLHGAAAAPDYGQFQQAASTRWLPRARVRRALLNLVLGFTRDRLLEVNAPECPLHVRLTGLRQEAAAAFGKFASAAKVPIISSCARYPETTLAWGDLAAADLYAVIRSPLQDPAGDKAHRIVIADGSELLNLPASEAWIG
ncbi:MAG: nucleotidyltransferase family protein [Clostridia bacterium]|nr:nucleotidyltransferase family protein [Clostridia bacterium]